MNFFISNAVAEEAAAVASTQSPIASLVPFALVFVVFYFLMIKPQKKKIEQEKTLLAELKKGDDIYTKSGILGKITGMTDSIVTLEIEDGVKFKMLKSQIGGSSKTLFETAKKAEVKKTEAKKTEAKK
ncbi:preprotein translocase subunit YajC [Bacteriovoracaceae bacterium]|nr:preprotein translocase subunit YajC [Bacteriovoracaceae bacterium]